MRFSVWILILICLNGFSQSEPNRSNGSSQSELEKAYQRELLFLKTYKKELMEKRAKLDSRLGKKAKMARLELRTLENQWLGLQTRNEVLLQKLTEIERDVDFKKENKEMLNATIEQAKVGFDLKFEENRSLNSQIERIYQISNEELLASAQLKRKPGDFFDKNGDLVKGHVVSLGKIARFGVLDGKVATLYPTGGGSFKVWNWTEMSSEELTLATLPKTIDLFMFENANKEFSPKKTKTWLETIQAGGLIAWIIVALGGLALVLSVIRFFLLRSSRVQSDSDLEGILHQVRQGDLESAKEICLRKSNSVTRVVGKTLASIRTKNNEIEDVISEGIITESQLIDRFGVFILVIASVAPLLGLLGTVTGMISTFDVITEIGTGNPKLLSGGISEALITTMLGLMVAIPTLLIGQFLGSMNESIKSDMEKWALAICTNYSGGTK